jgi:hypothetical protein
VSNTQKTQWVFFYKIGQSEPCPGLGPQLKVFDWPLEAKEAANTNINV